MQALLDTQVSAIANLKRSIAETLSSNYNLPFDGSDVQIDIFMALYYYWDLKKKRISRTLQAIRQHGIVEAVDRLVSRDYDSYGFTTFNAAGMNNKTFEHVVFSYPEHFSDRARIRAIGRLI